MAKKKWEKPQGSVNALFIGRLLPAMWEIPEEFRNGQSEWCNIVSQLFFCGGQLPSTKDGIDPTQARNHIVEVLRSWAPKHEHKEAGVAYLMSLWYEMPVNQKA